MKSRVGNHFSYTDYSRKKKYSLLPSNLLLGKNTCDFPFSSESWPMFKKFYCKIYIWHVECYFKIYTELSRGHKRCNSNRTVHNNAESIPKDYLFQTQVLKALTNKVSSIVHKICESHMTTNGNFSLPPSTLKKSKLFIYQCYDHDHAWLSWEEGH